MNCRPLAALLVAGLCGCSSTRVAVEARAEAAGLTVDPDRYIVAGVDNEAGEDAGHAGSSPRGYDGLAVYGPTPHAQRLLHGLEREYGMREITAWPIAPLHMHCAVLEIPAGADRAAVLAALSRDVRVRIAQPLQNFTTQTSVSYDDPYVDLQRGFQRMDVPNAHPWSRGEGVRVAIIDTGADDLHPDLRGAIAQTANFVDSDVGQFRRDRHGTELAGIIAAVANNGEGIVGIAPGARLSIFKACWQLHDDADSARCNSYTLARALTAALDSRAQVVNLSLAGPADPLLRQLIEEGLRRGILFVGAAPPEAAQAENPLLQLEGVIEVADDGVLGGPGAPLRAPGREILTLLPGGRYDFASGTSVATAHVTGIVALLLAKNSKLTAAAVYQLLRDTTMYASGGDSVDACGAVTALIGHGICRDGTSGGRVAMH
ncbi:MAG TPA: S8 family serine peptidase [Steroidobacteraceae bacterium]|nr:S8 family serine peptidase [Steroidobacteraceae bacterium]